MTKCKSNTANRHAGTSNDLGDENLKNPASHAIMSSRIKDYRDAVQNISSGTTLNNGDIKHNIAIIGAGPAGCACAFYAQDNCDVTLFDFAKPLHTLLYTGGGRCNLAHGEYDFKELAKNYPRGEKFLYSIFSRFSTCDSLDFFENIGVPTYTQDDLRIFPTSNSAEDVRIKMLDAIRKCKIKRERVLEINKEEDGFLITTDKSTYRFDKVVIAVGGHAGFGLAKSLGHKIIAPKPALVGLLSKESFKPVQGVSLKNVCATVIASEAKQSNLTITDDLLFTHNGISGPLAYKISSICARFNYDFNNPLRIKLNLCVNAPHPQPLSPEWRGGAAPFVDSQNFQDLLNTNSKKDIKNLVSDFVPKSVAEYLLGIIGIDLNLKCSQINAAKRDLIVKSLTEFEINIISPANEGEVVTSGGVCLDEINPKTMQSKLVEGLYFAGEVIDVDGFCGGFNLQNCWSTGFVAGSSI